MKRTDVETTFFLDPVNVYETLLQVYIESAFRDFERYPRRERVWEINVIFFLNVNTSQFRNFESQPGVYEVLDNKKTIPCSVKTNIAFYDFTLKTMLNTNYLIWLDGKTFSSLSLDFSANWIVNLVIFLNKISINRNPIDKNGLKCSCKDGSTISGVKQLSLYSFNLNKPSGYKDYLHQKQYTTKNFFMSNMTFYLAVDEKVTVDFVVKTLTFAFLIIKVIVKQFVSVIFWTTKTQRATYSLWVDRSTIQGRFASSKKYLYTLTYNRDFSKLKQKLLLCFIIIKFEM